MTGKDEIRKSFILRRQALEPTLVENAGRRICFNLEDFTLTAEAETLAAFHPAKGEPDISRFISGALERDREICFPRFNTLTGSYEMAFVGDFLKDFVKGPFGIPEPKLELPVVPEGILKNILWLVPGTAFDFRGGRLGYGKGIYDSLLADATGIKIGICYDWQIIESVPSGKKDIRMDFIVTESGIRRCCKNKLEE